jgi:hypothetical protein
MILSVLSYGCGTWYPTLREGRSLMDFVKKVLMKIFEFIKQEATA